MPIEFREVRRGEIDDAYAFAVDQGADVAKAALRHQLSLVAINAEKTILGSALHEVADDARRHIHIHLKPDTHPGLGRLLIDRALRKAEAAHVATTHVTIHHDAADQCTWTAAAWPRPVRPVLTQAATPVAPEPEPESAHLAASTEGQTPAPADTLPKAPAPSADPAADADAA